MVFFISVWLSGFVFARFYLQRLCRSGVHSTSDSPVSCACLLSLGRDLGQGLGRCNKSHSPLPSQWPGLGKLSTANGQLPCRSLAPGGRGASVFWKPAKQRREREGGGKGKMKGKERKKDN